MLPGTVQEQCAICYLCAPQCCYLFISVLRVPHGVAICSQCATQGHSAVCFTVCCATACCQELCVFNVLLASSVLLAFSSSVASNGAVCNLCKLPSHSGDDDTISLTVQRRLYVIPCVFVTIGVV